VADTELKIRVSAQLADTKQALESLTQQLAQIARGGTELGAAATAGFVRMEQSAERAAAAASEVAAASARISQALEQSAQKAAKPLPVPKPPKAALTEGVADQIAVQKVALKQQLTDLEQSHKAGLTSIRDYYHQRAEIQRAALNAEIAQQRAALNAATTQQQKNLAATRIATLTQQRSSISAAIPSTKPAQDSALGLQAILGKVGAAAAALGVTISAIGTATAFVKLADEAKNLEGRLKLATTSTAEYNLANAQLFKIAQSTRSEFGQVVGLYSRLAVSTKTLGVSQGELLRATETVSKAIKLSFTGSAESANAALMQLGQGLASGTLRGEELNSILEQAPRLAQAIANGMGKTTGELKKLGEEGKITAQNVLGALKNQAATIDTEFKVLPRNIDGSMTMLKNALLKGAGEIDKVAGVTNTLADALESLVPIVDRVATKLTEHFARIGASGGVSLEQLTKSAGSLTATVEEGGVLSRAATAAWDALAEAADQRSEANQRAMKAEARQAIETAGQHKRLALTAGIAKDAIASIFSGKSTQDAWRTYREQLNLVNKEVAQGVAAIEQNLKDALEAGDKAVEKTREQAAEQKRLAETKPAPAPMGPPEPPKKLGKVDWREVEKERDARRLEDLKRSLDLERIAIEEYYAKRLKLQLHSIDLEIAQAKKAEAKATTADTQTAAITATAKLYDKRLDLEQDYQNAMEDLREGSVDYIEIDKEHLRQQLEELKRDHEQSLIAHEEYYRRRLAIQQRQLDLEIEAEEKARDKATTVEARRTSKTRIALLEEKRVEQGKEYVNALEDEERKAATTITQIRTQALAAEHKLVEARKVELEAQYADLIKRLTAEGDQTSLDLIAKLFDTELAKARLAELQAEIDKVMARFHAAEQSAANAVALGTSKKGAASETREAAEVALADLERPRAEMAELGKTSLEARAAVQGVNASVDELKGKSLTGVAKAVADLTREFSGLKDSFSADIAMALRDNLAQLFTDIITGSKRGTDAIKDFAKNFAKSVAAVIAQIMATRVAMGLLKGFSFLGFSGTTAAPVKHSGGLVGAPGGVTRSVPIETFFGAPRLHQGGVLASDEVPTILQKGEEVLSKGDVRNVRNAVKNAPSPPTTMLVQLHPDHNHRTMRDWLEGELARVAATS
jgi:tape measure domain-containing protein